MSKRIASREFVNEKNGKRIVAEIFTPRQVGALEWACRYVIRGLRGRHDRVAYGIDSLQALFQAMQGVRYYLQRSEQRISFLGRVGDLGIHRALAGFDVTSTRYLERVVEREMKMLVRARKKKRRVTGTRVSRRRR